MKNILLGLLLVFGTFETAQAQVIDVQASRNDVVKIEGVDCDQLEYTKLELTSRNTVVSHCSPILCKIKPRTYVFGSNSDFEITRFDGDQSVFISQVQHKKDLKNKVQELIDSKVCKTFEIFGLPAGEWPGKNVIW